MHARVVTVHARPGKMDELIRVFEGLSLPDAKMHKGFRGMILLTDAETNKVVSVSIWENEAATKGSEDSGYLQTQVDRNKDIFDGPPTKEYYEVTVNE